MSVEFVSYTGEYPNLCAGILTVKINGKEKSFGYNWPEAKSRPDYPPIWSSGGNVTFDEEWNENVTKGEWKLSFDIDDDDFPKYVRKAFPDIIKVMNENVPYGCCGGCV